MVTESKPYHFDLEHHGGAVKSSQEEGALKEREYRFWGLELLGEDYGGIRWVRLGGATFAYQTLNHDLLSKIKHGERLREVEGGVPFTSMEGKPVYPVAAVLYGEEPVYRCPEFDLKKYLSRE